MADYLLLLLADGNLPTGAFVASAGVESHAQHALLHDAAAFVQHSATSYAHAALPFARDAHCLVRDFLADALDLSYALSVLTRLDALYEAATLNHVARRASRAQGVALLTLYTKGFARPSPEAQTHLVDALKLRIRRDDTPGHLPVCWGVLTAALGLPLGASNLSL